MLLNNRSVRVAVLNVSFFLLFSNHSQTFLYVPPCHNRIENIRKTTTVITHTQTKKKERKKERKGNMISKMNRIPFWSSNSVPIPSSGDEPGLLLASSSLSSSVKITPIKIISRPSLNVKDPFPTVQSSPAINDGV